MPLYAIVRVYLRGDPKNYETARGGGVDECVTYC